MPLSDEELAAIDPIENLKNRPPKDEYFLAMASVVAMRSFDPSSKCGCVIVSKDGRVLSTGYNGPVKGSIDEKIPLTRPERYYHMIHAEENALLAYSGSYQDIQGATVYLTGSPCHRCLRMMIQKGITRIVRSDYVPLCVDEQDKAAQEIMLNEYEYGDTGRKGRRPRINIVNNQQSEIVVSILDSAKKSLKED
jgi:dCMP deaminase